MYEHENKHWSYLRNVGSGGSSNALLFCPVILPSPFLPYLHNSAESHLNKKPHRWRNCSSWPRAVVTRSVPAEGASNPPVHESQQLKMLSWLEIGIYLFIHCSACYPKGSVLWTCFLSPFFPSQRSPAWLTCWTGRLQNLIWYWTTNFEVVNPQDCQIFV